MVACTTYHGVVWITMHLKVEFISFDMFRICTASFCSPISPRKLSQNMHIVGGSNMSVEQENKSKGLE